MSARRASAARSWRDPAARLDGFKGEVRALAFSADGRCLATGDEAALRLSDTAGGAVRVLAEGAYTAMAFLPDGSRLLALTRGGQAQMWDFAAGRVTRHWDGISALAIDPAGGRLVLAAGETVRLYDAGGKEVAVLPTVLVPPDPKRPLKKGEKKDDRPRPAVVRHLAFAADGRRLALGAADVVSVVGLADNREAYRVKLYDNDMHIGTVGVAGLAYSPDGECLVAASSVWNWSYGSYGSASGSHFLVLNARTGKQRFRANGVARGGNAMAFSPDGLYLAVTDEKDLVRVWDVREREQVLAQPAREPDLTTEPKAEAPPGQVLALQGRKDVRALAFSPDGARLAVAGADVCLFDSRTGQGPRALLDHDSAGLRGPGPWVALNGEGGLTLVNLTTGRTGRSFTADGYADHPVVSADGGLVAAGIYNPPSRSVVVWDARTGRERWASRDAGPPVCLSPDGKRLLAATADGKLVCLDAATGKPRFTADGPREGILRLAYSPDGKRIAAGGVRNEAVVYDADGAVLRRIEEDHDGEFADLCFSPDGTRLATAAVKRQRGDDIPWQIRVHDVTTGRQVLRVPGRTGEMPCVAYSSDGLRLAVGSYGFVTLYDARNGQEVFSLPALDGEYVMRVAFLADGSLAAATRGTQVAGSRKVHVWDTRARAGTSLVPPADAAQHRAAAVHAYEQRRWFAALFHLDRVPAESRSEEWAEQRGDALAELGRWDEAIHSFQTPAQKRGNTSDWNSLARAQLAAGQVREYRTSCARMLASGAARSRTARLGALALLSPTSPLGAAAAMQVSHGEETYFNLMGWVLDPEPGTEALPLALAGRGLALAAVLFRAGRHREALAELDRVDLANRNEAWSQLWRAFILRGLGQEAKAAETFKAALVALVAWEKLSPRGIDPVVYRLEGWRERAAFDHLRREFERAAKR